MSRYRQTLEVEGLHLNADAQPADIADFVSRAARDFDVNIRPSSVVLRSGRHEVKAEVGDWLVLLDGHLSVWGNSEFVDHHERID